MGRVGVSIVIAFCVGMVAAAPAAQSDIKTGQFLPIFLKQYKIEPVVSPYIGYVPENIWRNADAISDMTPMNRGIIQNFFNAFVESLQEIVNRQQSLLDLIYCKNCENGSPWQGFLTAMAKIPMLGWVMKPNTEVGQNYNHVENGHPAGTFIAATNINGVVSGVGGSIYSNEPVVEYTFNNNKVTPVNPNEPPSHPAEPLKVDVPELPTASPNYSEDIKVEKAPSDVSVVQ